MDLDWPNRFQTAAGLVSGAALVIPQAWPMAALYLTWVSSDPAKMIHAARAWLDSTPPPKKAPVGPFVKPQAEPETEEWHAPMQTDIPLLRAELRNLLTAVEANKDWQGDAFEAFKKLVEEFDGELERLGECRKGMCDSLESAASLYEMAGAVLVAIAGFVSALAVWTLAMRFVPAAWVSAHATASKIIFQLTEIVIKVCKMMGKLKLRLVLILGGIGYIVAGMNAKFPGMQAIKGESPNFTKAKAVWDQEELTIKKAPDLGLPDKKIGGGLGNLIPGLS
ncbi:WXG100 family type VII secretion target [Nonomuraea africana]|uniref:WXG100 family type VII secretion target n=1 Tax=Nonomuraea africana TaxID=46171 RepID=UPI0033F2D188